MFAAFFFFFCMKHLYRYEVFQMLDVGKKAGVFARILKASADKNEQFALKSIYRRF